MAIFVAFGWVIQAGEWLGLIETEAQDPNSRAYRLAHQGLSLLKGELGGRRVKVLAKTKILVYTDSGIRLIACQDGILTVIQSGEETIEHLDLGPGGGAQVVRWNEGILAVEISARTSDGGSYDVALSLPVFLP